MHNACHDRRPRLVLTQARSYAAANSTRTQKGTCLIERVGIGRGARALAVLWRLLARDGVERFTRMNASLLAFSAQHAAFEDAHAVGRLAQLDDLAGPKVRLAGASFRRGDLPELPAAEQVILTQAAHDLL